MFQGLTYSAFNQFISDKIQDRLANALKQEGDAPSSHVAEEQAGKDEPPFVATEIEVLNVIKAILGGLVDVRRLDLRQTKRYCSVVLHDSPEREDYGGVLFQLYARLPESVRLVATGMTPIHVEQIYDFTPTRMPCDSSSQGIASTPDLSRRMLLHPVDNGETAVGALRMTWDSEKKED